MCFGVAGYSAVKPFCSFFFVCGSPKKGIIIPGVCSGDRGNRGKVSRRGESHAGKIDVMKDLELYGTRRSPNSIILKQVNASVAGKKKKTIRW